MDLGLSGRIAIVTGASKGLGRGVAFALAEEGVSLVIAARNEEALCRTRDELTTFGIGVETIVADVTERGMSERVVELALQSFGRLDIVVSNSGGPPLAGALEISDEQIMSAVEANMLSHVRFARAALPVLREAGWGRLLAVASYGVVQALPELSLSNLSRSGLRAWAKTAAYDLGPTGVTLNLIAPGVHLTDRVKETGRFVDRMGDPADFGRVAAFLCSTHASFVNGTTVVVDGGRSLAL